MPQLRTVRSGMSLDSILFELSLIVVGAATVGTLFLYARQPMLLAYIAIGCAVGPNGFALIPSTDHIAEIAHFGVILLLFLIGLHLQPLKLLRLFRKTAILTCTTSAIFAVASLLFAFLLGFDSHSAVVFGVAMMFSSTVVGLKLVPTTTLHHKRTGEVMTSVLLLQDVMAILVILFVSGERSDNVLLTFALLAGKFVLLCLFSFAGVRYITLPLLRRFDVVQEYSFILTLGWCMLWAEIAHLLGLSYEMGAFVAGLSIASCKVALVIAERLKPLREFFLILFFFAVGAEMDLSLRATLLVPALLFGTAIVPLKAGVFRVAFQKSGETASLSRELAVRLAQSSEFSLLVVFAAVSIGALTPEYAMVIKIATIVTFVVSTYWVVMTYPTPISARSALRRD